MGLTHVTVEVANPKSPKKRERIKLLVDSGALYSLIPRDFLVKLGVKPYERESFILATGEEVQRDIADAVFFYRGKRGPSKVVVGEPGDSSLIGVVTLESLGFALDPLRREIKPLKMMLA